MLGAPRLLRLPLHFLNLVALRVRLGTRVDERDRGENRACHSGQNTCVNIHDCESMMNESDRQESRKKTFCDGGPTTR
jgi:hypothetical protein